MSRIAVIGAGYVGLTTAGCLADLGNEVVAVDIDAARVRGLVRGRLPIYEPGLKELLERNQQAGRLRFTTSYAAAIPGAEFAFIAVATPEGQEGAADLSAMDSAARSIAEAMTRHLVVVNKSTVPVGTGDHVAEVLGRHTAQPFDVVSNPEFLREGTAIADFMHPDRVVIGSDNPEAAEAVARLYAALQAPMVVTTVHSAEMIKYASNAFLATRVSFINEIARIAERVGAEVDVVARGMGLDSRIGPQFLSAGLGYGGSCLPKDVKALAATARKYDYHPELLHAVMDINRDQRRVVVDKLEQCLGDLEGKVVGLLGLAFKPDTDDLREAPSLALASTLLKKGASVRAYDPVATAAARRLVPGLRACRDALGAGRGADAVVLVTEWNEFRHLDLARLRAVMRRPVLVDGRNLYDPVAARAAGFEYRGIGRN